MHTECEISYFSLLKCENYSSKKHFPTISCVGAICLSEAIAIIFIINIWLIISMHNIKIQLFSYANMEVLTQKRIFQQYFVWALYDHLDRFHWISVPIFNTLCVWRLSYLMFLLVLLWKFWAKNAFLNIEKRPSIFQSY